MNRKDYIVYRGNHYIVQHFKSKNFIYWDDTYKEYSTHPERSLAHKFSYPVNPKRLLTNSSYFREAPEVLDGPWKIIKVSESSHFIEQEVNE